MKSAVLEFQRGRVKRQQADADSIDILQTLADLREDLQCIQKVINAVERIATAQMGEDTQEVRKAASRKKRPNTSTAKRKGGVVVLPRLAQTELRRKDSLTEESSGG
jgi:hypothetical protein